jgi:ECF transporter S component (folate family)
MSLVAVFAAMCAVLGYLSLDLINLKITFEDLPVILGSLLLGPVDGMLIGGIGTLIYQLLRYGVSATTILWMLPYILAGLLVGAVSARGHFHLSPRQIMVLSVAAGLMITVLNTGVMYIDSKIYGYYSFVYIFGTLGIRLAICIGKAIVYGLILPRLSAAVGSAMKMN